MFVLFACIFSASAHAQNQDAAVWAAVLASPHVTDQTRVWLDVHARRDQSRFLAIVRPGVGWQATEAVSGWLGYAFVPSLPDDGDGSAEHRIWEQLTVTGRLALRVRLQSRTRVEQRFASGGGVGLRIREFVRLFVDNDRPERARLALWDELFVGLNETDWGAVSGLDQNRLFVGVGLPNRGGGRVELGGINVLLPRNGVLGVTWVVAANWFPPTQR